MATIKDIALLAGVSHGTVSNVINKKGNVSAEKIFLVEKAAKQLGYQLNSTAKQLRQGTSKKVCLIVPRIDFQVYSDLFISLHEILLDNDYDAEIYFTNDQKHTEKNIIEKISSSNPSTIITVSSFTKNNPIFETNARLIFIDRFFDDMPKSSIKIGFDFYLAGMDIAKKCIEDKKQNIAILCGDTKYSNYSDFINGVKQILDCSDSYYKIYLTEYSLCLNKAFEISDNNIPFDAIITTDFEFIKHLQNAYKYSQHKSNPEFYTIASKNSNHSSLANEYHLNYKALGRKLAKYIIKSDNSEKISLDKLKNSGFSKDNKINKNLNQENSIIKFLTLKSPVSNALKLLIPDFTNKTGIKVKIIEDEYSTLEESVKDSITSQAYDLIRMDMLWLSSIGSDILMRLNPNEKAVKDIINLISPSMPDDYFKINNNMYSFPFDASVQILYYRKDLFSDALIRREFYEKYKKQLELPKTFAEFKDISEFFTKKYNKFSPTEYGTSMVCGNAIVCSCDFLPRIKCQDIDIIDSSGNVKINQPKIKKAIEEYIEINKYTKNDINTWWRGSIQDFAYEKTAMIIIFSNYASLIINETNSKVIGNTGFAAVPGNSPLLGGGVVGISKNSSKKDECLKFLNWLYSEEIATIITKLGGYINNKNLLDNIELLELYPWLEGMEKSFKIGRRNYTNPKNSNYEEYKFEEILGQAIRNSTTGVLSIDDALIQAQRKCDLSFNNLN